ncbi:hypothetical protein RRG08_054978 [Elysia crispata]|uniref:Uncharacterized protein n=1 Tax=Elysia crispata TaxID=231223 RepID=A0AAE1AS99_9GAST|nr:hypothetical protein RRG08_054978 [Elysia crispata]
MTIFSSRPVKISPIALDKTFTSPALLFSLPPLSPPTAAAVPARERGGSELMERGTTTRPCPSVRTTDCLSGAAEVSSGCQHGSLACDSQTR